MKKKRGVRHHTLMVRMHWLCRSDCDLRELPSQNPWKWWWHTNVKNLLELNLLWPDYYPTINDITPVQSVIKKAWHVSKAMQKMIIWRLSTGREFFLARLLCPSPGFPCEGVIISFSVTWSTLCFQDSSLGDNSDITALSICWISFGMEMAKNKLEEIITVDRQLRFQIIAAESRGWISVNQPDTPGRPAVSLYLSLSLFVTGLSCRPAVRILVRVQSDVTHSPACTLFPNQPIINSHFICDCFGC